MNLIRRWKSSIGILKAITWPESEKRGIFLKENSVCKQQGERIGKNPAADSAVMLKARKIVTVKCSGKLRNKINGVYLTNSQQLQMLDRDKTRY